MAAEVNDIRERISLYLLSMGQHEATAEARAELILAGLSTPQSDSDRVAAALDAARSDAEAWAAENATAASDTYAASDPQAGIAPDMEAAVNGLLIWRLRNAIRPSGTNPVDGERLRRAICMAAAPVVPQESRTTMAAQPLGSAPPLLRGGLLAALGTTLR